MRRNSTMRRIYAIGFLMAAGAFAQAPVAPGAGAPVTIEIMRRAVERNDAHYKLARYYTFIEREEERDLDAQGKVKSTHAYTYDVTLLSGSPYRRIIEKDDKPLSPKDEKKEAEKLQKSIKERENESESERNKRLAR